MEKQEKIEKIINLTPHSVMINGIEIKSSGVVRLQERNENVGLIAGIPTIRQVRGEPEGLPEVQEGIWIIVSRPIFDALPYRKDLLAIGETIRDSDGKINSYNSPNTFRGSNSFREFLISGLCQKCQDSVFKKESD